MSTDAVHAQLIEIANALGECAAKVLAVHGVLSDVAADTGREGDRALTDLQRSALIDSVLQGHPFDEWSLWETAELLQLPSDGPFVVIAAEIASPGTEPLPAIESKLRSMDVFSVWRLLPDLQVGVVHIRGEAQLDHVLALASRTSTARMGVSARFDDLREAANALRYARVSLRGRPEPGVNVTVFDGSILATAAVSAPEVMVKLAAPIIESFDGLAPGERDVLFDTFRVWLDTEGSLREAGELLFCHPNTVRYRLHRIEQWTGRSLARPRDVAELSLVLEVYRQLMWRPERR
ncbi:MULTISPECIES: helix-turn-helix domain-containing protein [unclassified Mycolicibacterium]|uniref:PucR family transcriptional regulator n=1 Tax=unclassified Mycolicibacterium TaxID=2636767 RepID=UPI0013910FCB|nr:MULTISPECIES: helix-turn-helix domain-containing protein [unclassified Mycolicibacterium]